MQCSCYGFISLAFIRQKQDMHPIQLPSSDFAFFDHASQLVSLFIDQIHDPFLDCHLWPPATIFVAVALLFNSSLADY